MFFQFSVHGSFHMLKTRFRLRKENLPNTSLVSPVVSCKTSLNFSEDSSHITPVLLPDFCGLQSLQDKHPSNRMLILEVCIWKFRVMKTSCYTNLGSLQKRQLLLCPLTPRCQLHKWLSDTSLQKSMIICTRRTEFVCADLIPP